MKCLRCRHENRTGAKFCEECAAPLARACPNCGSQASTTAKFCPECAHPIGSAPEFPAATRFTPESYTPKHLAEKILTSKIALEGERKQITVLFADLKGSMELLADRDPEDARKLLDPVLERMMEAVHHYEGTVNRVMGDGIMALFGAPIAHEDHAVRACYAALDMQASIRRYADEMWRAHGIRVQIRVGLNSGEVVVRAIRGELHVDYRAAGLAARMEKLATPGTVLMTADTLRLVEGHMTVKPLGPAPVKGVEEVVEIYELTGAGRRRSRLHAAAARGLASFVGREGELEQIRRALGRASGGHGQLVAIVGEPGVGKSRLVWEITHSHRVHGWLALQADSVSFGKATSYLPLINLLKSYSAIDDRDGPRALREKLTGKLLTLDPALEGSLPALLSLLDVPSDDAQWQGLDPPNRRRRILDAVKGLLLRESQVQPLLVVFEDLHWIDSESQALLNDLVESLPAAHLLLLVNYRPEYQHPWGSRTYYTQIGLDALPAESAEELLRGLLGDDPGLRPLQRLLMERTEGNPFFLEESARSLIEAGTLTGRAGAYRLAKPLESVQVPATVQSVLASRIDRLPPEEKRLIQAASVIGKDVPFSLLQRIGELPEEGLRHSLAHLQAAEFLYEASFIPDLVYAFKHGLTRDVAYGSLLKEQRRTHHARIVEAIEGHYPGRLTEQVEQLAHHALCGELPGKAVHYLRQAGLKAAARSALQDARSSFKQALGVLEVLPQCDSTLEQAFEIRLELRPVLVQLGEIRRSLERLREAETLAEQLNDDRRRARVGVFVSNVHTLLGELDEALVTGTRALEIAGRLGDLKLRIHSTSNLEYAQYYRGEYGRVVELAIENLATLPPDWVYEYLGAAAPTSVYDRCWLVMSLAQLGRFAEAAEHEAEALRLAEPMHHSYTVGLAHWAAGTVHLFEGDWLKARSLIERWIEVLRAGNVVLLLPTAVASSAWVLAQLGESSEALVRIGESEQLLDRQAARGVVGSRGWADYALGRACLVLGRLDDARRLGARVVESLPGQLGFAALALHLLGDIATHPDRFDGESGEAHYRQALVLAEPRGMRPLVAHCHRGLGRLYRRTDKRQEAQEHLTTATAMYREMGMWFWLEQAQAEMRELG